MPKISAKWLKTAKKNGDARHIPLDLDTLLHEFQLETISDLPLLAEWLNADSTPTQTEKSRLQELLDLIREEGILQIFMILRKLKALILNR